MFLLLDEFVTVLLLGANATLIGFSIARGDWRNFRE
jgi:hypothetical protein